MSSGLWPTGQVIHSHFNTQLSPTHHLPKSIENLQPGVRPVAVDGRLFTQLYYYSHIYANNPHILQIHTHMKSAPGGRPEAAKQSPVQARRQYRRIELASAVFHQNSTDEPQIKS
ncbi:MAG: hypothetical protein WD491_02900 [Balneolales bacterium]